MDTKHTHSPCCSPAAPKAHAHSDHEGHKHDHAAHSHADDHDHGHDHGVLPGWPRISAALVMALLAEASHWLAPQIPALEYAGMALAVVAIGLSGLGVYQAGLKSLAHLQLGIHALMAVAVTGAFLIGQWPEAAMVMALYAAAERIEDQAMDRARLAIRNLLGLTPDTAEVLKPDGSSHTKPTAEVPTGATVRVPPGARIPLDGTITAGHSSVNQAPITGESVPVDKTPGDSVWAGSINQQAELQVQVTAATADSMLARIVKAVEQAQARKAPTQRFVDRFAAIYTPIVMVLAIALAVLAPLLLGWAWLDALYQALALLVIACPCALVLSTPVTVVSALTAAARHGVLLKGGSVLESARHLRTIALDKTGTLTTGQPALVAWEVLDNATTTQADVALLAWQMASRSAHPVSHAIAQGLHAEGLRASPAQDLQALPGRGVQARIHGATYYLVNLRWAQENGLASSDLQAAVYAHSSLGRSVSLLATSSHVLALFAVADTLRPQARQAVQQLQAMGIAPVVLSGDHPDAVRAMATQAGINQAEGGLLPEDKLQRLHALQAHGAVGMVGDGINDAPALAKADIGFAMGGAHSTGMAMETADVVLMHDDLRRIPDTIALSQRAHRVLWQNIGLALGIKAGFFALAVSGHASMWLAVLADMGVSLLVVANGLRLRRTAHKKPAV
ncbi:MULTISPECIES: heavy metal translocating P-type ATPase [Comamonas]|uniref:heavy metal translocating P-type ATPase n=1 Tax=Comamonas TaxID=283 RepID=UPI00257C7CBE|nr:MULTISPECIES: heavy metal translocating P-type ATPase [Comamonas]